MVRNASVAIVCAMSCVAPSVFAAAQSSASIDSISFQLIDLNPFDGIATNYSFVTGAGSTTLGASAVNNPSGEAESLSKNRTGTFKFSQLFSTDVAETASTASISNQALTAYGSATAPSASYSASASTGASSHYYSSPLNLTLSANSVLLISAQVSVFASAINPQGGCGWDYCAGVTDQAIATATMQLNYGYMTSYGHLSYSANETLSVSANAIPAYAKDEFVGWEWVTVTDPFGNTYQDERPVWKYSFVPKVEEARSQDRTMTLAFVNYSDSVQSASLYFGVSALGMSSSGLVAAVPEAETYALVLAGLGVVAMRRRKARL